MRCWSMMKLLHQINYRDGKLLREDELILSFFFNFRDSITNRLANSSGEVSLINSYLSFSYK
jgi:hypothetical protein